MNHYILISDDEYKALQTYRANVELERIQRVLAYWKKNVTSKRKVTPMVRRVNG